MQLGTTGQSFFSYCRDIHVRGKRHLNRCSSEMQKRSWIVSPLLGDNMSWSTPDASVLLHANSWLQSWREGERKHILQFYYGRKYKYLKSDKYWGATPHHYAWRWGMAQLESCMMVSGGTKMFVCGCCEGGGRHCHDFFSPPINPSLVLQPSPSFKETENVLQRSTVHLFKIICKSFAEFGLASEVGWKKQWARTVRQTR